MVSRYKSISPVRRVCLYGADVYYGDKLHQYFSADADRVG